MYGLRHWFALLLLLCCSASAQRVKSTLSGVVTDSQSAAVPGAEVRLINEGTGVVVTLKTSADGAYGFPFLDTGTYSVQVSSVGFKTLLRTGIAISSNADQRLDLTVDVGEISQKVEVAAETPQVNSVNATVGTSIKHDEIENLPLLERNVLQLINLIPGSTLGGTGTTDFNPSINGTRPRGNNFTVDGISINQEHSGTTGGAGVSYSPQVEAVGELNVLTSNYSAEYGRAMGSVISLSLLSGTNKFRGSFFNFMRNDVLNARSYFLAATAPKPKLRNNQLGGSLGGRIIRDKLFFFATGEQLLQHSSNVSTFSVPTRAMLQGDFSSDANTIYDPATVVIGANGVLQRQPFPGNRIPTARFDRSALPLAAFWPQPDAGSADGTFTNASVPGKNAIKVNTKVDYYLSDRDNLSVRVSYNYQETIGATAVPGPGNSNTGAFVSTKSPGFQTNHTHTFRPNLINELRGGFQRTTALQTTVPEAVADWRTQVGLPQLHSDPKLQYGFPNLVVTGLPTLGASFDRYDFFSNSLNFNDTLSYTRGKHFFKFGGALNRIQTQDRLPGYPAGLYTFSGTYTSNPGNTRSGRGFADMLLGWSSNSQAGLLARGGNGYRMINWEIGAFIQDDYRVSRKLTLNIGLRWDLATPLHTLDNVLFSYDPSTNTMKESEPPNPANRKDFGPRFGFAYLAKPTFVIRGGYGISFFPQFKGLGGFFAGPPISQTKAFPSVNPAVAALTFRDTFGEFDESASKVFTFTPNDAGPMFGSNPSPYMQAWNLTLEKQIKSYLFSLSYVGNKGTHLENIIQANQLSADLLGPDSKFGGVPAQRRRPFPNAGRIQKMQNDLNSHYHSLQAKIEKRFSHGLSLLTAFTWSKSMEVNRAYVQDHTYRESSKSQSLYNVPKVFVQSGTYELPVGKGKWLLNRGGVVNSFVGGWRLSGILTLRDGYPVNVVSSINNSGSFNLRLLPNIIRNPNLSADQRTVLRWYDPAAYTIPDPYTFGNASNFTVRGPGMVNLSPSLAKVFRFWEGKRLEFRAEAYNVFNTPGFGLPDGNIGGANAGRITGLSNQNRALQFALRLMF